jgi:uracil-DNA glycosylase
MLSANTSENEKNSWKDLLQEEKQKQYFQDLLSFIERERQSGKTIYPQNSEIFSALSLCPFEQLKVVIIGQDPYHGPGQAHGLCFSVRTGVRPPPSLKNIFKELFSDLAIEPKSDGDLSAWAKQGVLLLNSVLSVEANRPASHANLGWETFTDKIISQINLHKHRIVYLLWGAYAQKKGALIDRNQNLILQAAHPSPFSAHSGFFGCKHFSQCNKYLSENGLSPIQW